MPLALRRTALLLVALLGLLFVGAAGAAAAPVFPEQTGFVVDAANVVPDGAQAQVEARLAQYADAARKTVLVGVVPDLGGASIDDYANDLFDKWHPRNEGDPGVIVVIAMAERQMRIEVGTPLQGDLVDAEAGRIIRDVMRPQMQAGDVGGAISGAVEAIIDQLGGDTGQALAVPTRRVSGDGNPGGWVALIFVGLMLMGVFGSFLGRRRGVSSDWMWLPILLGSGHRGDGGWSGGSSGGGFGGGGGFSGGGFGGGASGGGASGGW